VLDVQWGDGVEDPVESDDGVDDNGEVVHPDFLVPQCLSQELILRVGIAETPIIVHVPEASVDGIDDGEGDKDGVVSRRFFDAVDAERHIEDNACHVLAQIEEMGECVSGIVVTAETLDCSPDAREGGEEAEETGTGRVAFGVIAPFIGVEAEEEFNVLGGSAGRQRTEERDTHAHAVCQ